ncbi:MAG: hypothetical protein ACE5EA_06845 [Nitrospirota bacterium]
MKRAKKKGRRFFLFLLIIAGLMVFTFELYSFKMKDITIFLIQRFMIDDTFVKILSENYSQEEVKRIRNKAYHFYEMAKKGEKVNDDTLIDVSERLQEIIADKKVTDEEIKEFERLINQY